jgi:hypothetical protein
LKDSIFFPNQFEVWAKSKLLRKENFFSSIEIRIKAANNEKIFQVLFSDKTIEDEIYNEVTFEVIITSLYSVRLLTIPKETYTENDTLINYRSLYGITREHKDFLPNEPFCCDLYFRNGQLEKMAFLFSRPEKLMEFFLL